MARIKKGDIFKITDTQKYFQFVVKDKSCLNGDVIRCFNVNEELLDLSSLTDFDVIFWTHTYISNGMKLNYWKLVGNKPIEKNILLPFFKSTDDVYSETQISKKWFIWKPNEERQFIGKQNNKTKHYPIGGVFQPPFIKEWAQNGTFDMKVPD